MTEALDRLDDSIKPYILNSYVALDRDLSADEAIWSLRKNQNLPDISYLYIVDEKNHLLGLLPTRKLLSAAPEVLLKDLMHDNAIAIPEHVTIRQALEFFTEHKYLGFPVVDKEHHLLGVIDVTLFSREVFDMAKRRPIDDLFETMGVRIANLAHATPLGAFRYRFPWFLATIGSGSLCAVISSLYGKTLEQSIIIAFFLTLVLGLAESMSVQSMTVTIQSLHNQQPSWKSFFPAFLREGASGLILALACGITVLLVVFSWYHKLGSALVIGGSVTLCTTMASLIGMTIPTLLHGLKLNFRIAAGPLTLAITDLITLTLYFSIASFYL